MLLLFGQGYTDVIIGEKPTHNTVIEAVFQFGLVGVGLIAAWFVFYVQTLLDGTKVQRGQIAQLAMLLLGTFGPWMALDYVFFDEFFLLPIYACMAVRYLSRPQVAESPLIDEKSVVL